jgi:hypothetical protein
MLEEEEVKKSLKNSISKHWESTLAPGDKLYTYPTVANHRYVMKNMQKGYLIGFLAQYKDDL